MNFDLSGRMAVVTGAAEGLGRGFALHLAACGASVACLDINRAGAEQVAQDIVCLGGTARGYPIDVSDDASVGNVVGKVALELGTCDILVNNAGIATRPLQAHLLPAADWDRLMAVNMRGTFLMTKALLPTMMERRRGSIINIASFIGELGVYPGFAVSTVAYAASKAGIIGFTRQLAAEYAKDGVRANAVGPGWHAGTRLGREREEVASGAEMETFFRYIDASVPMGRRGSIDELSGLVLYLASDLSSYVTGQAFFHDGGRTAV